MDDLKSFVKPVKNRFLGAKPYQWGEACDIIILGVPSGLGSHGFRSPVAGPAAIRKCSRVFAPRALEDAHPGWWDYEQNRPLLSGVKVRDAGNLIVSPTEPLLGINELPGLIEFLRMHCGLVFVLGGDHSLTFWTAQGMGPNAELLFFDAHEDATTPIGEFPHCGNVISYIESLSNITLITQFGLRGLVPDHRRSPVPHREILLRPEDLLLRARSEARPNTLLSIDTDVLDPSIINGVVSPMPLGKTPDQLVKAIATALQGGRDIQVLELMEFAPLPSDGPVEALALNYLFIRLLDQVIISKKKKWKNPA